MARGAGSAVRRYEPPRCVALDAEGHRCGHAMEIWKEIGGGREKVWVFGCPYCGARRAISDEFAGRYCVRA